MVGCVYRDFRVVLLLSFSPSKVFFILLKQQPRSPSASKLECGGTDQVSLFMCAFFPTADSLRFVEKSSVPQAKIRLVFSFQYFEGQRSTDPSAESKQCSESLNVISLVDLHVLSEATQTAPSSGSNRNSSMMTCVICKHQHLSASHEAHV